MVMMDTRAILRSIKLIWALPILAVAITSGLMIVEAKQNIELWANYARFSDTPQEFQAPARLFVQVLDGPSFYFKVWRGSLHSLGLYFADTGCLPFVALFWFWVGWGLDRRIEGKCTPWIRSRVLRGTLYAAMLVLTCLFGWIVLTFLESRSLLPPSRLAWRTLQIIKWRSSALQAYAMLLWTALFIFYFARKFVVTLNLANTPEAGSKLTRTERIIWLCLSFELIALLISIVR